MTWVAEEAQFKSDGTRVAYLNGNITLKPNDTRGEMANRLRKKLLTAYDNGKIRVIPREDPSGNRLALRRDIGKHYRKAEQLFQS
jgi:phosphoribosylamine--glycine ligase